MEPSDLLTFAHEAASRFLNSLDTRPVRAEASADELRTALGGPLPELATPGLQVIEELVRAVEPGLVASVGPRYFGFVTGGSLPSALAADWLTAAWDQNAFGYATSPAASVVEEICAGWLLDILRLPSEASVGFVTGGQMANFTCLCAARDELLRRAGWDLEEQGLNGSPNLTVFVAEQGHATIWSALRMLGIGKRQVILVPSDAQGRMEADALERALAGHTGPTLICAQAGNVNTGAFDPIRAIVRFARAKNAWVHVDGAFGLWAAAHPDLQHLVDGVETADSWATDGHKWLNVPYDSGFAIVADAASHRRALRIGTGSYLVRAARGARDGNDWVPESSRRARGFAVYAVIRALGRAGIAELIGRCCTLARRMAQGLEREASATLLNDVVLNQVLVRFEPFAGADIAEGDAHTRAVIERVQRDGVCWVGPTVYNGRAAMRVSVCNASTQAQDIDRSIAAIATAVQAVRGGVRLTVSVSLIRGLVDCAVQAGASEPELLRCAGLSPEILLEPSARVSAATQDALIAAAQLSTGDPGFGLRMGQTAQIGTFGLAAHMVLHARNVREALDVLFRFHRVIADCEPSRLVESGDRATVIYNYVRTSPLCNRVRTEFGLTFFHRMGTMLLGGAPAVEVYFEHKAPEYAQRYREIFGPGVHFEQEHTGFSFERALLDRAYLFANTAVFDVLRGQAEKVLRGIDSDATLAERVHFLIVEQYTQFEPTMQHVARTLGMSERSLRRRLTDEGTSFRKVVHIAMAELARAILREPETTFQDASHRLGFSEPSAFHHAFKRWTGTTPSQYRASLAPGEPRGRS